MKKIKLGIIGMSEGNGHPYSWSAIFNGYDKKIMESCPFPAIPCYLSKQRFPEDLIKEGKVTHIWTQDKKISEHIAAASHIDNIVDCYLDFMGEVDAVLLARDDYENHYEMSIPFLKAGLPIYIDKPIAINERAAEKIFSMQNYEGQIFTGSALGYAREFQLTSEDLKIIGAFERIEACTEKSWAKYGVHIIDPVLRLIGDQKGIKSIKRSGTKDKKTVTVEWNSGLQTIFSTFGDAFCPVSIRLCGSNGFRKLIFEDTFFAFRAALMHFVDIVLKRCPSQSKQFALNVVRIIEQGGGND